MDRISHHGKPSGCGLDIILQRRQYIIYTRGLTFMMGLRPGLAHKCICLCHNRFTDEAKSVHGGGGCRDYEACMVDPLACYKGHFSAGALCKFKHLIYRMLVEHVCWNAARGPFSWVIVHFFKNLICSILVDHGCWKGRIAFLAFGLNNDPTWTSS